MARSDMQCVPSNTPSIASDREVAEYIASLLNELERMATTHGLVELGYDLRSARERAEAFQP